jgi:hypothetical protein
VRRFAAARCRLRRIRIRHDRKALQRTLASAFAVAVAGVTLFLLRTEADEGPPPSQPGTLLFWSRYEGDTALETPGQADCSGQQCWQYLRGADTSTGHTWRAKHSGITWRFQALANAPVDAKNVASYMVNRIEAGAGRNGSRALYSEIKRSGCCGTAAQGGHWAQDPFLL